MQSFISKFFSRQRDGQTQFELERLTRLVRRYSVEQQQVPKNLAELVSLKYLEVIPVAPPDQKFVIDRNKVEVLLEDNSPN